jgi:hypothetical protein
MTVTEKTLVAWRANFIAPKSEDRVAYASLVAA